MSAETQDLRVQLDQLQDSLATRQSTTQFAQAGISVLVGLLLSGAAGKLFHDSLRTPVLAWLVLTVALGLFGFGAMSYRRGRATLKDELTRYAKLLELRQRLRLDDPAALLPR